MFGFKWTEIIGAIVGTVVVVIVIHFAGNVLINPSELKTHAYPVPGVSPAPATASKPAPAPAPATAPSPAPEPAPAPAPAAAKAAGEMAGAMLAKADIAKGKIVAKKCGICHTLNKGGPKKIGPNLWNIVNAPKARSKGYRYSKALARAGGNWGYEDLNRFLTKPRTAIPGNKMTFSGVKKISDRAALIAYLRILSDNPAPLP